MSYLMNRRVWLYGFLSWLIPFVASFLFFDPATGLVIPQPLFKSLMVVIGGGTGATLLVATFRSVTATFASCLAVGFLWLAINLSLDIAILVPMAKMTVTGYFNDIGLRYLMLPIVAGAMGAPIRRAA